MNTLRRRALAWARILTAVGLAAPGGAGQEPAPSAETVMLRMRDGGILWGSYEAHDPTGISFRRLDNGGLVRLPYGLLDAAVARELQLAWGYADLSGEELLIDAERIPLVDG